jgi:hypothetical protein
MHRAIPPHPYTPLRCCLNMKEILTLPYRTLNELSYTGWKKWREAATNSQTRTRDLHELELVTSRKFI